MQSVDTYYLINPTFRKTAMFLRSYNNHGYSWTSDAALAIKFDSLTEALSVGCALTNRYAINLSILTPDELRQWGKA
jgi:hypothetical protein